MEKYGFVYLWFDRKHKRYYVGCHWGYENDGYVCSSPWMRQAYKHRPQDFKRRVLKTSIDSREATYIEEQRWLNMIKPQEIKMRYYNLKIRNNEVWHKYEENIKTVGQKISASPLRNQRISESHKGMRHTEETKQKLREINTGKKQSSETIAKKIAATTGKKRSNEFKTLISQYHKNRSPETRKKISENNKRLQAEGRIGMAGKKHSVETKERMRAARLKNINKK